MTGAIFHPGKVIAARNLCLRYEPYDLMEKNHTETGGLPSVSRPPAWV